MLLHSPIQSTLVLWTNTLQGTNPPADLISFRHEGLTRLVLIPIFMLSSIAFPRPFAALHLMEQSKIRSHIHVRLLIAYFHSFVLHGTLMEYLNFNACVIIRPKCPQGYAQVVACHHSSSLYLLPMKHPNFTYGRGKPSFLVAVPELSKLLHNETSRRCMRKYT